MTAYIFVLNYCLKVADYKSFLWVEGLSLSIIVYVAILYIPCITSGKFFCLPVGTFNQTQATEYCLTVKDVALLDSPFSEDNME